MQADGDTEGGSERETGREREQEGSFNEEKRNGG